MSRGRHTAYVAASIMKDAPTAFQNNADNHASRRSYDYGSGCGWPGLGRLRPGLP